MATSVEQLFKPLASKRQIDSSDHGIVICGHRGGAKGHAIENTLGAFKYALKNDIKMIEFDVSTHIFIYSISNTINVFSI